MSVEQASMYMISPSPSLTLSISKPPLSLNLSDIKQTNTTVIYWIRCDGCGRNNVPVSSPDEYVYLCSDCYDKFSQCDRCGTFDRGESVISVTECTKEIKLCGACYYLEVCPECSSWTNGGVCDRCKYDRL